MEIRDSELITPTGAEQKALRDLKEGFQTVENLCVKLNDIVRKTGEHRSLALQRLFDDVEIAFLDMRDRLLEYRELHPERTAIWQEHIRYAERKDEILKEIAIKSRAANTLNENNERAKIFCAISTIRIVCEKVSRCIELTLQAPPITSTELSEWIRSHEEQLKASEA